MGRAAHQTVFFVACNNLGSEILAAFQILPGTVETLVRIQRHRLDADEFPMFLDGWLDLASILSRFGSLLV